VSHVPEGGIRRTRRDFTIYIFLGANYTDKKIFLKSIQVAS